MIRRQNRRFSIMIAGSKGSGKSSFFNTLIGRKIVKSENDNGIDAYMLNIDCEGIPQKLTLIDTPGFGSTLDDSKTQDDICKYIKEQFDSFIKEESKIRRDPKYEDPRVHCLIYLIPATSSGLKNTDVVFLKKVSSLVNIIPIISKSDGLSIQERSKVKNKIVEEFTYHEIPLFDLDNPEICPAPVNGTGLNSLLPFLIVSADTEDFEPRTRSFEWGTVNIINPEHCDFSTLKEVLFGSHTHSLIDYTASELYENYRASVLGGCDSE